MKKHFIIPAMLLLINCGGADKKVKAAVKETAKPASVTRINFFMETSASMAGYLAGGTQFKNTMLNLLSQLNTNQWNAPLNNYFIADTLAAFNGPTQDFISAVTKQTLAKGKSSQMDKLFQMVANKTGPNEISLFVSDCILSYPDKEIKKDPEINRSNAPGALKSSIYSTFAALRKKNIGASVYGFSSSFKGKYFTYQNTPIILKGDVPRPYYLWVIGNKDLLPGFNAQLKQLPAFTPEGIVMDFGVFTNPVSQYEILYTYAKNGDWSTLNNQLKDVTVTNKNKPVFSVALNLNGLPSYTKDTAYLLKHLQKEPGSVSFNLLRVAAVDRIDNSKLKKNEKDILSHNTHIIVIQITDIYNPGKVGILLPLEYDTGYRNLSIMDDRNKSAIAGKTFAFEHLIDGVRDAYQSSNQYFIHISVPVKK
ncbi:MAG TPA: hypothetical protein VEB42_03715 [Chitinophagaceae bacterium]|nr:hypothetical protein [Chitinophagaceae bacterium]